MVLASPYLCLTWPLSGERGQQDQTSLWVGSHHQQLSESLSPRSFWFIRQRAEEPMSTHRGKEGKDIHPSFIPSFLQRALSEHCWCTWPFPCLQGNYNTV